MDGKIRYSTAEAQTALGVGNTKFWELVKAGKLTVYYDGNKGYVSAENLRAYDATCRSNTTPPDSRPRSRPGRKGVQAPA